MKKSKYDVSFGERVSYALGDVGCNFVWATVGSFLTMYYTDSVGISAAVAGTIMLLTRILDGFTDLGMGMILDHTNTKWGKARPWILWSAPFMALGLIALFNVPESFSDTGKIIYASVTYIFVACFAYTASNLAYNTLLALMTSDLPSRVSANSIRFICTAVLTISIAYVTNPLIEAVGWSGMAFIYAGASLVCFVITFSKVKERGTVNGDSDRDKVGGIEGFRLLFKNRYFITLAMIFICYYLCANLYNSMGVYYARDLLGDKNLFGTLTLCTQAPLIISLLFVPTLASRFGKWKCMMVGYGIMILGMAVVFISTPVLPAVFTGTSIRGFGMGIINACIFSMVADAVDFGEWKTGVRQAGLTNSATSFGMKVGTGLGQALTGWGLEFGGYDASLAVQSEATILVEKIIYVGLPVMGIFVCIIFLYFTNIDKIYPTIRKELDERLAK